MARAGRVCRLLAERRRTVRPDGPAGTGGGIAPPIVGAAVTVLADGAAGVAVTVATRRRRATGTRARRAASSPPG
ncbi:hypothetical protein ACH4S8_02410 [Streptomyces sp. NPDC021080]|uniref:hypothetical protein n=1 Tax=Streptomyces sp. NPDC021080 TaxID=3365110 RepID=UPI00378EAD10